MPRTAAPPKTRRTTASRRTARTIFAVGLVLLTAWMARNYLAAVGWAVLIAIASWPLYALLEQRIGSRHGRFVAPAVFIFVLAAVVSAPLVFLGIEVAHEAQTALGWLAEVQKNGVEPPAWLVDVPLVGQRADQWWRTNLSDPSAAKELLDGVDKGALASLSKDVGGQFVHRLLIVVLILMILFFLFRDGKQVAGRTLDRIKQWTGDSGGRLADRLGMMIRGIVRGMLLLALINGALLSTGYFLVGVPYPLLFGCLTGLLAMVPLGAWLGFGSASLVLLVQGHAAAAGGLFVAAATVMVLSDNFVQPAIVGNAAHLPLPAALIGILGGLETFGLVGVFLGPIIMAALIAVWETWVEGQAVESPTGGAPAS